MKIVFTVCACAALLFAAVAPADAVVNANGKWALHFAGTHDTKNNTCDFTVVNCSDIVSAATGDLGRYDVYVVAVDVVELTATRYGICCSGGAGTFYFYGWTNCADLEIPTDNWPGCGEANAQTYSLPQPGPNVTWGILDVYHYGGIQVLSICVDNRVGFAEFCDGSDPSPICYATTDGAHFGCLGFGCTGYNPCSEVPVMETTWGKVKATYR